MNLKLFKNQFNQISDNIIKLIIFHYDNIKTISKEENAIYNKQKMLKSCNKLRLMTIDNHSLKRVKNQSTSTFINGHQLSSTVINDHQ